MATNKEKDSTKNTRTTTEKPTDRSSSSHAPKNDKRSTARDEERGTRMSDDKDR